MKLDSFEMRDEKLIAKIHPDNARSLKAFQCCVLMPVGQTPVLKAFAMTSECYLPLLRESPAGHAADIYITEIDKVRLRSLVAFEQASAIFEFEPEIERAVAVDSRQAPQDVVTELQGLTAAGRPQAPDACVELSLNSDRWMARVGRQAVLSSTARPTAADLLLTLDRGAQGIGGSDADTSPWWAPWEAATPPPPRSESAGRVM